MDTIGKKEIKLIGRMKDLNNCTVMTLKEKLKQMNLSASSNKSELILSLNEAYPTGQ